MKSPRNDSVAEHAAEIMEKLRVGGGRFSSNIYPKKKKVWRSSTIYYGDRVASLRAQ